jgi:hypothetical protein
VTVYADCYGFVNCGIKVICRSVLSINASRAGTAVTSLLGPSSLKRVPRADFGLFLKSQGSEDVERPLEIKLQRLNAKKDCHSGLIRGSSCLT